MPSLKRNRESGNERDGCLATIETMKETFVIVQAIPHEKIRDSVCQHEARVKRVGKALIPICSGQPWPFCSLILIWRGLILIRYDIDTVRSRYLG